MVLASLGQVGGPLSCITPRQGVLDCTKKKKVAQASKKHLSVVSALVPAFRIHPSSLEILPWLSSCWTIHSKVNINPFLPKLVLVDCCKRAQPIVGLDSLAMWSWVPSESRLSKSRESAAERPPGLRPPEFCLESYSDSLH